MAARRVYTIKMLKSPFFILLFFVLVVIAILHALGLVFFWYVRFTPLDIVVHFLGGFWVAGMVLWLTVLSGFGKDKNVEPHIFFISLIAGLLVGVGWEIFEFAIFKPLLLVDKEDYMRDTTIDLVMDISGALVAAWYFLLNVNR